MMFESVSRPAARLAVPHADGDVARPDLRDRNIHRAQAHLGLGGVAVGRDDATGGRVRFEQDHGGAVATDDQRDGAGDVRGHLVGRGDLGQRVRQLQQAARGLGLSARVFHCGGGVERGRDQARVRLEHDPLLREEPAGRVDCGEPTVPATVRLHLDDEVALVDRRGASPRRSRREAVGRFVADSRPRTRACRPRGAPRVRARTPGPTSCARPT